MFTRLGALGRAIANSGDLSVPSEQLLLRFGGSMSRWALASDHALGGRSECAPTTSSSGGEGPERGAGYGVQPHHGW